MQAHNSRPLNDFIEYPYDLMQKRCEDFYANMRRRHSIRKFSERSVPFEPWLIAIFSQKKGGIEKDAKQQNYYIHESVGIATGMLITALHNAGLATLTHTPKPMSFLSKICQRPEDERPYMLVITGYPAKDATVPEHALKKKDFEQICNVL